MSRADTSTKCRVEDILHLDPSHSNVTVSQCADTEFLLIVHHHTMMNVQKLISFNTKNSYVVFFYGPKEIKATHCLQCLACSAVQGVGGGSGDGEKLNVAPVTNQPT